MLRASYCADRPHGGGRQASVVVPGSSRIERVRPRGHHDRRASPCDAGSVATRDGSTGRSNGAAEPAPDTLGDDERRALRAGCDRALQGHRMRTIPDLLGEVAILPAVDLTPDVYGDGGVVAVLEREVRDLLAKPAAVFMPSGIMAQQIALRIHGDRRSRRVVAFHPTCHLELHEDKAYQRLHRLIGRPLGDGRELLSLADLEGVGEPLAALLVELPQREIGGRLPAWDDLVALVASARER